ncbi:hypothetical protein KR044_004603, partial [Drosophila immigrans]
KMEDNTYFQLIEEGIKLHFERNGTLDDLRSGLHVKVLKMLHSQKNLRKDEPLCGGELEQRGLSHLLNQLIVDYFEWYGFNHTLETFSLESGIRSNKSREKLRRELNGNFNHKELPILLEMVMKQTNRNESQSQVEDSGQQKPIKVEKSPKLKKLEKVSNKLSTASPQWNSSPIIDASKSARVDKFAVPTASKHVAKTPQPKVNIRQRMVEPESSDPKSPKKRIIKTVEKTKESKNFYETETLSESTKSSSENNDCDTTSSETFADIPNRYYYREQEPPEKTYASGYGEEGPYEGQSLHKSAKPSNSHKSNRDKMPKSSKHAMKATNGQVKASDQSTTKRGKFVYHSNRRMNSSDDDLNMPVTKPRCPDTIISSIEMDSDDEDTDD